MLKSVLLTPVILLAPSLACGATSATPPVPPNPACAPPPAVETGAVLGRHKDEAGLILRNFDTAYRRACVKGVLRERPLIGPGSVPPRLLFLKNAPDANIASIYEEGGEGGRPGRMVLEYPFIADDGAVGVPGAEELEEAIFCAVRGATAAEQEEEGRCLPD